MRYGLPSSQILRILPSCQPLPVRAKTLSPTLKRSSPLVLHASKPLIRPSLSRCLPMKTKRHSRFSSAPHFWSLIVPEKSMPTPWKTYFLSTPATARTPLYRYRSAPLVYDLADPHLELGVVELAL